MTRATFDFCFVFAFAIALSPLTLPVKILRARQFYLPFGSFGCCHTEKKNQVNDGDTARAGNFCFIARKFYRFCNIDDGNEYPKSLTQKLPEKYR